VFETIGNWLNTHFLNLMPAAIALGVAVPRWCCSTS